jgi:energy-coupling factor transporter transmembrane protein EcfT
VSEIPRLVRPAHEAPRPDSRHSTKERLKARRASEFHVLRYVPGSSVVHRLWAGTKLVVLAGISVALLLWPTWAAAGLTGALLLAGLLAARLPRGVAPHVPRWIWAFVLLGALLALAASGKPYVHLGGLKIGLNGLDVWALFATIAVEFLGLAALIGWTSPLADLAPALSRLASPLRRVRLPVDELIGVIALSIRCLPLLLDEARVLSAARRSRRSGARAGGRELLKDAEELLFSALSSALRRSREMAEAIEARGGVPTVAVESHRLQVGDLVVLVVATLLVTAMALLR